MFEFIGDIDLTYMNVVIPGEGSLVATKGRRVDFHALGLSVPADGRWIPVAPEPPKAEKPAAKPAKAAASKES